MAEMKNPFKRPDVEAKLSDNAITILKKRYLKKNAEGEPVEEYLDMFWRVATFIAAVDLDYGKSQEEVQELAEDFYKMMVERYWEPNSPTLMNAGRPLGQLSACFVLPVADALSNGKDGIYDTLKSMALVHQSGGGTGFSFSRIRPEGSLVKSTTGVASGPVSFMELYDASTEVVKQGGCVVPDTLISTIRGVVPIRELGPADAEADTWHPHELMLATDEGVKLSDEFYVHGVAPVKRIRTKAGYSMAATHQHRVRVIHPEKGYVWKRMDELQEGDWLALQKGHLVEPEDKSLPALSSEPHFNATEVQIPTEASAELGEFLGYLIGDGAFNRYNGNKKTGRLVFTVADSQPEVTDWLKETTQDIFGVTPRDWDTNSEREDESTNFFLNATTLSNWLEDLGVAKPSAHEARVPEVIFRKGEAMACGFLRGLFTADGSATPEGYVSLSSVSIELLEGVQQLLLAVGVPSAIGASDVERKGAYGTRPLHRLRVITQAGMEVFSHKIGFIDNKRQSRLSLGLGGAWEFNDVIPHPGGALREAYDGPGRGSGPGRSARGANRKLYRDIQHYLPGVSAQRTLQRSRLKELAERHEEIRAHEDLVWFLSNEQFYDQVVSIEDDESLTLDLSVPDNNTYIANGFVSHNTRRGANMGILRVDHPDVRKFIKSKENTDKITNFNISVAITDAFMNAYFNDEEYELVHPRSGEVVGKENAREIFEMIIDGAWANGEPGVFFIDEANRYNPVPHLGDYEATNPCGEQNLLPYDVCNLGSLNLGMFVRTDVDPEAPWQEKVDWEGMKRYIHLSTHFLDNVIDANKFPLPEIHELAHKIRRIGNGVMGWADMLVKLRVPYSGEQARDVAEGIAEFFHEEILNASENLAAERGVFPEWPQSIWGPDETCAKDSQGNRIMEMRKLRNSNVNTVAPTGTISIIADCSGGIEPLFAVAFMRNQAGSLMPDVNKDFVRIAKEQGWHSEDLMERIAQEGHIHFDEVPEDVQKIFITAHDVKPEDHVHMQAAWQRHTDNAISKCIAKGTLIPTDKGLVPVDQFAHEHAEDTFAPTTEDYLTGGHRILSHYRAGEKNATRIRLDNGAELVGATESHRVFTPEGWKLMSDLKPGDIVLGRFEESHGEGGEPIEWMDSYRTNSNQIPTPTHMTPAFARFLGMIAADGYTLEADGRVEITCKNEEVDGVFRKTCMEVFGREPNKTTDKRNGVWRLYLTSRNLVRLVESLIGSGAYNKRAPLQVLRGSYEEKIAFMEGVTLDGYKTSQGLVLYAGMSKELAYHVAEMARSFGLPWVAQGRKWVEESKAYSHDVVISNDLQLLVDPIEPHKRSAATYKRYKVLVEEPQAVLAGCEGGTTDFYAAKSMVHRGICYMFDTTARRMGLDTSTLVHKVTEVVEDGMVEMYDVEVEDAHEYVVNGMISHNTTNFPREATREDVQQIYELAYKLKCKGVTVYRDGSREGQVLSTGKTEAKKEAEEAKAELDEIQQELEEARQTINALREQAKERQAQKFRTTAARSEVLRGTTRKIKSPLGDMYVTINEDEEGRPFEVFATLGKAGGAAAADVEAICRMASLALRSGLPLSKVHRQLRGISSDRAVGMGPNKVLSIPDAIAQAIERYDAERAGVQAELPIDTAGHVPAAQKQPEKKAADEQQGIEGLGLEKVEKVDNMLGICSECGSPSISWEEGCMKCHACGSSECG